MFSTLAATGFDVGSNYSGIYHVRGNVLFETQIISTKELPVGSHIWLKALTRNIDKEEARQVVNDAKKFSDGSRERELADSVLQVAVSANFDTFEILKKEDPIMCDALRELMKPEMDEALDNNKKETAERMIRKEKYSDSEIADISGLTLSQVKALREEMKTAVRV